MIYSLKESVHKLGVNIPNKVFELSRYFFIRNILQEPRTFFINRVCGGAKGVLNLPIFRTQSAKMTYSLLDPLVKKILGIKKYRY